VPIRYNPRSLAEGKKIRAWHGIQALLVLLKYRVMPMDAMFGSSKNRRAQAAAVESVAAPTLVATVDRAGAAANEHLATIGSV
jgi:hypothetical protein